MDDTSRPTGHWIRLLIGGHIYSECSACEKLVIFLSPYCPRCGAHMIEPIEERYAHRTDRGEIDTWIS